MTLVTVIAKDAVVRVVKERVAIAVFPNASVNHSQNRIKVPFSWGDATPKTITSIQGFIKRASIVILNPFNVPSLLSLGDDLNSDRLISKYVNNPSAIAEYETSPMVQYISSTSIKLTIAPGEGCNQGNGFVILEV
jgi:hypothetical protein